MYIHYCKSTSTIKHTNITIIPALQKLYNRRPDKLMTILWNPGCNSIISKETQLLAT